MRFVIVGGLAATIRGSSYVTFDLDFSHARDRGNLSRLAQASAPTTLVCAARPQVSRFASMKSRSGAD